MSDNHIGNLCEDILVIYHEIEKMTTFVIVMYT